jgi:hypothetical protein
LISDTVLVGLRLIFIDKPDRGAFFSCDSYLCIKNRIS